MAEAKRVMVLTPSAATAQTFNAPAQKLALELVLGCGDATGTLQLNFNTRDAALAVVTYAQQVPFAAIVAVSDETAAVAARAASMLGLPFHTPKAGDACHDKQLLARKLQTSGVMPKLNDAERQITDAITLECLMTHGHLRALAAFDRRSPSPLLPASLLGAEIKSVSEILGLIVTVLGLKHGPVQFTFLRISGRLEVTNVSCSYVPRSHTSGMRFRIPLVDQEVSFEELILRNALDLDTSRIVLNVGPSS
jgi:hypothetical protein